MFERLRSRLWPSELAPRLREWTTDRSPHQSEGERLFEEGDFAGAELHLAEAVLEGERRQGPPGKRILLRLELAEAQRQQAAGRDASSRDVPKLELAEQNIRSALELANKVGEQGLAVQCMDELAAIMADQGNLAEAERLVQEAARLEASVKRRDPLAAARRLQRLAKLRHAQGQSAAAVEAQAECVAIHEKSLGEDHAETARRLSELAALYHALGKHAETQRCLRRALPVHERQGGAANPEAAAAMRMLVESFEASGSIDAAAALLERALTLKLREVGANLDEIADQQAALGHRYMQWRRYSRARELMMEAVGTFKRSGGIRLALGYECLGQIEEETGHYNEALRELGRAGKAWESIQSAHIEELIQNLEHRAFLFMQMRQDKEAAFLRAKVAALVPAVGRTAVG
jgi:tetratricopeptide (TPR) repeat protein